MHRISEIVFLLYDVILKYLGNQTTTYVYYRTRETYSSSSYWLKAWKLRQISGKRPKFWSTEISETTKIAAIDRNFGNFLLPKLPKLCEISVIPKFRCKPYNECSIDLITDTSNLIQCAAIRSELFVGSSNILLTFNLTCTIAVYNICMVY